MSALNDSNLRLTIFTSFLGAIRDGVRAVAYDYSDSQISIYCYLSKNPDGNDYEAMDSAITEIMASYQNFIHQKLH